MYCILKRKKTYPSYVSKQIVKSKLFLKRFQTEKDSIILECPTKPYSFLVIDNTLASNNPLGFRKNLLGRI